jgi:ankyrin repeat protein
MRTAERGDIWLVDLNPVKGSDQAGQRPVMVLTSREFKVRGLCLVCPITQGGDLARVNKIIEQKYPLNRFDDLGMTPLHYAVQNNRLEVVKQLIEAGANVNAHDERVSGNTPLSDCARESTYEMAKMLIDAGADPTIRGWMQMNALDRARERKDANARKIVRLLEETPNRRRV